MTPHLPVLPPLPAWLRRQDDPDGRPERPLRIVRVDWPFPALELVRPDGHGWLLMRLPQGRYRLVVRDWPSRGLHVTDTPRPNCPDCGGRGAFQVGYPGSEEPDEVLCTCWDPELSVRILPLPRWTRRSPRAGYSDEPPF